jgi:hypothetical protein
MQTISPQHTCQFKLRRAFVGIKNVNDQVIPQPFVWKRNCVIPSQDFGFIFLVFVDLHIDFYAVVPHWKDIKNENTNEINVMLTDWCHTTTFGGKLCWVTFSWQIEFTRNVESLFAYPLEKSSGVTMPLGLLFLRRFSLLSALCWPSDQTKDDFLSLFVGSVN